MHNSSLIEFIFFSVSEVLPIASVASAVPVTPVVPTDGLTLGDLLITLSLEDSTVESFLYLYLKYLKSLIVVANIARKRNL